MEIGWEWRSARLTHFTLHMNYVNDDPIDRNPEYLVMLVICFSGGDLSIRFGSQWSIVTWNNLEKKTISGDEFTNDMSRQKFELIGKMLVFNFVCVSLASFSLRLSIDKKWEETNWFPFPQLVIFCCFFFRLCQNYEKQKRRERNEWNTLLERHIMIRQTFILSIRSHYRWTDLGISSLSSSYFQCSVYFQIDSKMLSHLGETQDNFSISFNQTLYASHFHPVWISIALISSKSQL